MGVAGWGGEGGGEGWGVRVDDRAIYAKEVVVKNSPDISI